MDNIPLGTGGYSAAEVAADRANAQREMAAIDRENQGRLATLTARDNYIGQAARAAVDDCVAQMRFGGQSHLAQLQAAATQTK